MRQELYKALVSRIVARMNCIKTKNSEWETLHTLAIEKMMKGAPSGSGIDSGTALIAGSERELVFRANYHHMNNVGYYCGWTEHKIVVKPSLLTGIEISITGQNKNDIKDFLHGVYLEWLTQIVDD